MTTHRTLVSSLAALLVAALPALAQMPEPPAEPAAPRVDPAPQPALPAPSPGAADSPYSLSLRPRGEFAFSADVKDSDGSVSVARAGLDFNAAFNFSERFGLSLGLAPEVSWYSFDNATGLIPGTDEPFNDLYIIDITPGFRYGINQTWSVFGGGLVEFAGESGADVGESATYGGYGGVRYAASDRVTFTWGLSVKTRLEESALFLPLLGVEWRITDRLLLQTRGPGLRLENQLTDAWSVYLTGAYESREFRLDDDGPLPEGIVRDRRVPIKIGVQWKPAGSVTVGLEGGAVVWQEFRIDDRDGGQVNEDNTKPTPFIGAWVTIGF